MAVSSSDKSDSRNVNSQKAEDYRNQIESKEKKHRNEISRIRKQQYEQSQKINQEHQRQVETLRAAHQEAMSGKERYFQSEMTKLNDMHRQRLRDQAETSNEKIQVTRSSAERDIKANKDLQERARERLENNYKKQIVKMDEEFRDFADKSRMGQKESYDTQKARYHKDKQKAIDALSEGHRQTITKSDRDLRTEREYREEEVKNLKQRMNNQAESMRKSFRSTLDRDRAFHQDILEANRIDQQTSVQNVKNRYQDALKENLKAYDDSQTGFRNDITHRVGAKIDSLEAQLADQEKKHQGESLKAKRFSEHEKSNIRREMKTSLEMSEEKKRLELQAQKDRNRQQISEKERNHQKDLHQRVRFYQGQMTDMREKHKMHINEKDSIHKWQENQTNHQTDTQVKAVREAMAKEQKNLIDFYEASLNDTRDSHRKDKAEFQTAYYQERSEAISSLNKKLQDLQRQYAAEREKVNSHYNSQIEQMAFNHRVDKNRSEKKNKETIENLQKAHARELEFTKAAADNKLEQVSKQHREEMQRLQDSHTQKMASLAAHKPKV